MKLLSSPLPAQHLSRAGPFLIADYAYILGHHHHGSLLFLHSHGLIPTLPHVPHGLVLAHVYHCILVFDNFQLLNTSYLPVHRLGLVVGTVVVIAHGFLELSVFIAAGVALGVSCLEVLNNGCLQVKSSFFLVSVPVELEQLSLLVMDHHSIAFLLQSLQKQEGLFAFKSLVFLEFIVVQVGVVALSTAAFLAFLLHFRSQELLLRFINFRLDGVEAEKVAFFLVLVSDVGRDVGHRLLQEDLVLPQLLNKHFLELLYILLLHLSQTFFCISFASEFMGFSYSFLFAKYI